jgi:tetratricopeptide (TPR) repeat protein
MKKLLFASISAIIAVSASAQSGKVISAFNYLQAYNQKEGAANLEEGMKAIDVAVTDPSTGNATKTWWYRSQIYQNTASEATLKGKYPNASLEACKSFQKMAELNEPKFKDWSDATINMKALTSNLFNDGVDAFNAKKFSDAYQFFYAISTISEIIKAKGDKVSEDLVPKALGNAALAAENAGDNQNAINAYNKLLPTSTDSRVYLSLINLNKKIKNLSEAERLTDEALTKYPNDKDVLINKINFFIAAGKQPEAIQYLKKAADQDPKNEQIQAALALSYDQSGDSASARKVYENLLTMNPNNFEANYGLGAMIFNQSKPIQEKINALSMSPEDQKKEAILTTQLVALLNKAKPYLLKAKELQPNNPEVLKALTTVEYKTK